MKMREATVTVVRRPAPPERGAVGLQESSGICATAFDRGLRHDARQHAPHRALGLVGGEVHGGPRPGVREEVPHRGAVSNRS